MPTWYGEMYALAMFHSPEVKPQITVTEAPRIATRSCRWHSLDVAVVEQALITIAPRLQLAVTLIGLITVDCL